jgi:hypothetical protein
MTVSFSSSFAKCAIYAVLVNVPEEVNVWIVLPPFVVIVPPVAVIDPVG